MGQPERRQREKICLACREKVCCAYYIVQLTGRDIFRIAHALQLSPLDFVRYCDLPPGAEDGFLLCPEGPYQQLVLAKRELPEPMPSPCLFLVRTNDQHALCGLGALRPGQCQSFPVYLSNHLISLINDPEGCVRRWSYGDIDIESEYGRIRRLQAEEAEHREIVADWNRRLLEEGRERGFDEFLSYLVNRYAVMDGAP